MEIPDGIIQQFLQDNKEGIRQLLTWFLTIVMEHEATNQAEALPYEKTAGRKAHRNGCREENKHKIRTFDISDYSSFFHCTGQCFTA